ncbi:GNAT family N-acetyltransferase [Paenibacillus sp. IHBB 10380]|uniref:GNAT family N-acetyltransferase n=1 Tax=Paenibacillus sp. IHBB 10380 TaxID=1566358 RepID=UPI0005CFC5D1|nr:GNAT family N-acetyltransferase [Paenibacillus sp. IHBB 10380]AJS61481.1 acetyltransferase [Paenibacillus sp. IHBB 10380]
MIYELERSQFHRCSDIVNRGVNIEEKAIVAGTNPGRIFVDNIEKPRSAMIWLGNLDGFIFIGDSKNDLFNKEIKKYIDEVITVQAKELGLEWFECIGNHSSWYITFEEIFSDRELGSWDQNVYTLSSREYKTEGRHNLDHSFVIKRVTRDMLESDTILNQEFLKSKILKFWESENDFFENGIGFCVLHKNEIASLCITGFRYNEIHGIDIETIESFQGKKLAQNVVHSFVEHCFSNGFTPYWDCMEVNYPSNAVAQQVGFKREFSFKGYEFKL